MELVGKFVVGVSREIADVRLVSAQIYFFNLNVECNNTHDKLL